MPLKDQIVTQAICLISHNKGWVAAVLSCRHSFLHSSVIPQLLSDKDSTTLITGAGTYRADAENYRQFYSLCALSDALQFSQLMIVPPELDKTWFLETVLTPLLESKRYFDCSLQSCEILLHQNAELLLPALSKVRSLHRLLFTRGVNFPTLIEALKSFKSLEKLELHDCENISSTDLEILSAESPFDHHSSATLTHLLLSEIEINPLPFLKILSNLTSFELRNVSSGLEMNVQDLVELNPKLRKLQLQQVSVGDTISAIADLADLEELELYNIPMKKLDFFGRCSTTLKVLVLYYCFEARDDDDDRSEFDSSELRHVAKLQQLEAFYCTSDEFDDECLEHIGKLNSLRDLDLSCTKISSAGVHHLYNMKKLVNATFFCCKDLGSSSYLTSPFREFFASLESVKTMNLSECGLKDSDLDGIEAVKNTLTEIHLGSNTDITHAGIQNLQHLVELKVLEVSGYALTDNAMQHLLPLRNLESLQLTECNIGDEGIRVLFSQNPDSFPRLRAFTASSYFSRSVNVELCRQITERTFAYLASNNNLRRNLLSLQLSFFRPSMECISSSISRLERLEELTLDLTEDEDKMSVIIRSLKNLKMLNKTAVTDSHRIEAAGRIWNDWGIKF